MLFPGLGQHLVVGGLAPIRSSTAPSKLPVQPLLCKVPRSWRHTRRGVVFLGGHEAGRSTSGADLYGKPEGTFFTQAFVHYK